MKYVRLCRKNTSAQNLKFSTGGAGRTNQSTARPCPASSSTTSDVAPRRPCSIVKTGRSARHFVPQTDEDRCVDCRTMPFAIAHFSLAGSNESVFGCVPLISSRSGVLQAADIFLSPLAVFRYFGDGNTLFP